MARHRPVLMIAVAACLLGACNTPSVPLPPPDLSALQIHDASSGLVIVQGQPRARHVGALFFILDLNQGDGVITTASDDGSFTTSPFRGTAGDLMQFSFETPQGEQGEAACSRLQIESPLVSASCL